MFNVINVFNWNVPTEVLIRIICTFEVGREIEIEEYNSNLKIQLGNLKTAILVKKFSEL